MVAYPPTWFYSACSFIGFVLCLIPLPWHLEAWNMGTCMYMIWTAVGCLTTFVNSVVWSSDTINRAPIWCDISSQIIIAVAVAIPASSLCINRRLYQIASVQSVTKTRAQKRRDMIIDLSIGLGIPLLELALHPIVQSRRFVIYEQIGCYPYTMDTPAAYLIYLAWPLAIGLMSAAYSFCTIRELAIRRAQFREFLSANRNLSASRYFRLMGLASLEIILTVPVSCVSIWLSVTQEGGVSPYVSWADAHAGFETILQVPAFEWMASQNLAAILETSHYALPLCAFIFFAFFGFADEARRNYRLAYVSVAKRVGLSTGTMSTTGTGTIHGTNPDSSATMVCQQTEKKRDSFASFSSRLTLPDVGGALADVKGVDSPTTTSSAFMSRESPPLSPVDSENMPLPTLPQTSFDTNAPPRYSPHLPHAI